MTIAGPNAPNSSPGTLPSMFSDVLECLEHLGFLLCLVGAWYAWE